MKLVIQVFITVQIPSRPDNPDRQPEQPRPPAAAVNPLQPVCPACGWSKLYSNMESARKGLAAHKQHCAGAEQYLSPFSRPLRAAK